MPLTFLVFAEAIFRAAGGAVAFLLGDCVLVLMHVVVTAPLATRQLAISQVLVQFGRDLLHADIFHSCVDEVKVSTKVGGTTEGRTAGISVAGSMMIPVL